MSAAPAPSPFLAPALRLFALGCCVTLPLPLPLPLALALSPLPKLVALNGKMRRAFVLRPYSAQGDFLFTLNNYLSANFKQRRHLKVPRLHPATLRLCCVAI